MSRLRAVAVVAGGALAAAGMPAAASAMPMHGGGPMVTMVGSTFEPGDIEVLAGDTVTWHNDSVLRHTVTASDGGFASSALFGGDMFRHRFTTPGKFSYFCTVHPFMQGDIDVHRVLLDTPRQAITPNAPFRLAGRSALPAGSKVSIERDDGKGFAPIGDAAVGPHGTFAIRVSSSRTARYRAVADGDTSPPVRLLVGDRRVSARVVGHGRSAAVLARVLPAAPGATVVLQLRLRNRFGWWPAARKRLDRDSRARFAIGRVHHRTRARVLLTLPDGATQLARSAAVRVGPGR